VRSTTNASRVHEVVVVLDSCFSGAMGNLPEANNAAAVLREGISILTASRGDQVSLESRVAELIDMLIPAGAVASAGIATYRPNTGFIMMAIDKAFPELLDVKNAITDVFAEFGVSAVTADDIEHDGGITEVVLQAIETSEFLFADLTFERPNVYYEVGHAHARNRRVILYRRRGPSCTSTWPIGIARSTRI
jgi:hypothetical protein